jgi:indolepyruvate ferredoxin oxidoreductase, beta subunit
MNRPITILICALGGEGGGVLAEWLYAAAVQAGHAGQSTSIPGVAQRTGATTYYLEVWPEPAATHPGRRPVFSLSPVPGGVDLLVSSELLEAVRQAGNGMVSADRTQVISSTARTLTTAEKIGLGDGRADAVALMATLQRHARAAELLDLAALAREAGTVISAVLLGAVAASGVLPFSRRVFEDVVRAGGKGVEPSLRGFALAFDAVQRQRAQREAVEAAIQPPKDSDLRQLGRARVANYQDEAYARLYDERLNRLAAWPAVQQELARWLALWMAFDDIVRVAQLKLAASRQQRVRREVAAADDEVVKLYDHFKPGIPEIAGLLPPGLAARLGAWDRRRAEPWALPLKIGSHTVIGTLALRLAAALKGRRRAGSRFAQEQALIERWLAAVRRGAAQDAALGLELARCGRLVKGYGGTNERGKENLLHIVDHLTSTEAVRAAREAALADEGGKALDQALLAHGVPARPLRGQPVRWHPRPADGRQAPRISG